MIASIAIAVEGALLAAALLLILALLRSHATILRRLAALEARGGAASAPGVAAGRGSSAVVTAIGGVTPAGDAVKIGLGPGAPPTLLAFLSSGCAACEPLWSGLHGTPAIPAATRLIVVTKGPELERPARLQELAPAAVEVVMSSRAWEDFAVPATPHFVLVAGEEGEVGRGSAGSWEQITRLLGDAREDAAHARSTAERAARAERALAASGITAGHPSLHPSRRPTGGEP